MTVAVEGQMVRAKVVVTGSPTGYKGGDTLVANAISGMGEGIWTVELKGGHSRIAATGIFKENTFWGDFSYRYNPLLRPDRGQWILKKQETEGAPQAGSHETGGARIPENLGTVSFTSDPSGAEIYADDSPMGKTLRCSN